MGAMDMREKDSFRYAGGSALADTLLDLAMSWIPLWVAVLVLLVIGWMWKPRWASFFLLGLRSRPRLVWSSPPGFGARRIWLALTALTAFQMLKEAWVKFKAWRWPDVATEQVATETRDGNEVRQSPVSVEDLKDFCRRLGCIDGGPVWQLMMEKSIPGMSYQAWRREPQNKPTEYRSRTIFDDVDPETLRDFFWDDEFRPAWDDMLLSSTYLEEDRETGASVAHWIRKFPFFCSDRDYIIGRRIWEIGRSYFCITQGIQRASMPPRNKPRRVDLYYSSWYIRAVESRKGDGLKTACEVLLFHHEDMGIPKEIAKLGVRQGMWGCVKKMEPGLRKYQVARRMSGAQLSRSAMLAQRNSKVPPGIFEELGLSQFLVPENENGEVMKAGFEWKWVVVGGAVVVALSLDKGVVGKALLFGLARRLGRFGR